MSSTESTNAIFELHLGGKLSVNPSSPLDTAEQLSMAYTPGVASVCAAIAADSRLALSHTIKGNSVAVVTDGSAVLGLGDIGPLAAMPVMEGKAMLFKRFAGIDAYPLCLSVRDPADIVAAVRAIAPGFGAILLEDISSPRCFEIEDALQDLGIPVMHDDQHGTAIVTLAALINAARVVGRRLENMKVVINGAGAAAIATARFLDLAGVRSMVMCDRTGPLHPSRAALPPHKLWAASLNRAARPQASLREALEGSDVFIGLSEGGVLGRDDLRRMGPRPVVFAMANPEPEIEPDLARGLVAVMATGRSDHPNQVNNALVFPGLFRGALDSGASVISAGMKLAAARALAAFVGVPGPERIVPGIFEPGVSDYIAAAVAQAARGEVHSVA
ncbi:MAG: NAD(P)-dependent malic enzyme [Candidatus Dormibacteria bacterium]